jgi:hypothetical protein
MGSRGHHSASMPHLPQHSPKEALPPRYSQPSAAAVPPQAQASPIAIPDVLAALTTVKARPRPQQLTGLNTPEQNWVANLRGDAVVSRLCVNVVCAGVMMWLV